MADRYRLCGVEDRELLSRLAALVKRGNELSADLLAHLAEVVERRLHLELGFPSAFAYCVEGLGLSEPAAGRRIAAAHLCRRFRQAFAAVSCGDLHLSALCALSQYLTAANADELFTAARGKSRRQIEELLAVRFPKPDVRQQIRRLPDRIKPLGAAPTSRSISTPTSTVKTAEFSQAPELGAAVKTSIGAMTELADQTADRCPSNSEFGLQTMLTSERSVPRQPGDIAASKLLAQSATASAPPTSTPLRYGVHFTIDEEARALFDEAGALVGHQLAQGDIAGLVKLALHALIVDRRKKRFAVGRRPRVATGTRSSNTSSVNAEQSAVVRTESLSPGDSAPPHFGRGERKAAKKPRTRHIPAAAAREVYERDGGQCTFVAEDGRRCGARRSLELDHIRPFAELGPSTRENLRLRCRSHNQHAAQLHFGTARIRAAVEAARRR